MMDTKARNEKYEEVARLLSLLVKEFVRKYGGDYTELRQEVSLYLLSEVLESHLPEKGSLSMWTRFKVSYFLQEQRREKCRKYLPMCKDELDLDNLEKKPLSIYERTQPDVHPVLDMIFLHPEKIKEQARTRKSGKQTAPSNGRTWKDALYGLMKEAGWTAFQIVQAFKEIREAL